MLLNSGAFDLGSAGRGRSTARLAAALASGGDARIRPDTDGRNQYFASILPTDALAYGSSTISSISQHAFDTLDRRWAGRFGRPVGDADYAEGLALLRVQFGEYFGLAGPLADTAVIFAASGTDLEYVGLTTAHDGRPLTAILLGRDEVGSGCIHSAAGRFFADETATGARVVAQSAIDPAFAGTVLVDVAVRDASGQPRRSSDVATDLSQQVEKAGANGRRAVVHVVHGSKSGLTLPAIDDVERLVAAHGEAMTVVVDACQLRISPAVVRRYLEAGCVVLMTGSKFAGGPPFSGIALVPAAVRDRALPLPTGFRRLATRAEWPADWPGADCLPALGNFGLLLRLQAAQIEIERFAALPAERLADVIAAFGKHVGKMMTRLELACVPGASKAGCLASDTLVTIDLASRWPQCNFDTAKAMHALIARNARQWLGREIRIGQPVKTHWLPGGGMAGTLRLSLSMPLIAELSALQGPALDTRLNNDMGLIGAAISASASTALCNRHPEPLG